MPSKIARFEKYIEVDYFLFYHTKWIIVLFIGVLDIIFIKIKGWSIDVNSFEYLSFFIIFFSIPTMLTRLFTTRSLIEMSSAISYTILFFATSGVLSYLAVSTDFPLVDGVYLAVDNFIHFDHAAYASSINANPIFSQLFFYAYKSILFQPFFIIIYLSATLRFERLNNLLMHYTFFIILTIFLSIFFPAVGAQKCSVSVLNPEASCFPDFDLLRFSHFNKLIFLEMEGLIAFPSVHAIAAVLFLLATWGTRAAIIFLPLNFLMLLSTPIEGGHYAADVIAGIFIAFFGSILISKMLNFREGPTKVLRLEDKSISVQKI